jgi:hypothetical protein
MNYILLTYTIYIGLSIPMTMLVANTLHRNGRIFLSKTFHGDEVLTDSVNNLLRVGFYLVNFGFIAFYLRENATITDGQGVFETLGTKMGFVLLILGCMHFMNIYVFNKMRRRAEALQTPQLPPLGPNMTLRQALEHTNEGKLQPTA